MIDKVFNEWHKRHRSIDRETARRVFDDARRIGRGQGVRAIENELLEMLPADPVYMDPPDGGNVTVLEQVARMAEDAAKWRAHQAGMGEPERRRGATMTDWKAAHDNLAARNALLRQRHDLPVDRIPAHAELVRLQDENARLRAESGVTGVLAEQAATMLAQRKKIQALEAPAADPVVEANRKLLLDRSNVGVEKYGTTLEDANLAAPALVQHALEEALDMSNYLQALLRKLS